MAYTELNKALAPVCGRMKLQTALDLAVKWLAVGALVAFAVAMCRVAISGWWPTLAALAVLVVFPLVGLILGMIAKPDPSTAARLIDERYHFDDRTATVVAATRRGGSPPLAQILLRETLERLERVKASEVVSLRLPRGAIAALLLALFTAAVALLPLDIDAYYSRNGGDAGSASLGQREAGQTVQAPENVESVIGPYIGRASRHEPLSTETTQSVPPAFIDRRTIVERYFTTDVAPRSAP